MRQLVIGAFSTIVVGFSLYSCGTSGGGPPPPHDIPSAPRTLERILNENGYALLSLPRSDLMPGTIINSAQSPKNPRIVVAAQDVLAHRTSPIRPGEAAFLRQWSGEVSVDKEYSLLKLLIPTDKEPDQVKADLKKAGVSTVAVTLGRAEVQSLPSAEVRGLLAQLPDSLRGEMRREDSVIIEALRVDDYRLVLKDSSDRAVDVDLSVFKTLVGVRVDAKVESESNGSFEVGSPVFVGYRNLSLSEYIPRKVTDRPPRTPDQGTDGSDVPSPERGSHDTTPKDAEPNNDRGTANLLTAHATVSGEVGTPMDPDDVYVFVPTDNGQVTVDLRNRLQARGVGFVTGEVHDDSNQRLAGISRTHAADTNHSKPFGVSKGVKYYVRVHGSGGSNIPYALTLVTAKHGD